MKNLSSILLSGLLISSATWAEDDESWSVQSTETQFEKTSEVMHKTSNDPQTSDLSLGLGTQSNSANKVNSQKESRARTIEIRPSARAMSQEFWIFDAWVEFQQDDDRDGYYNHFSVEFDADTEFSSAKVYARLYLAKGEVFKEFHTTSDFNIFSDRNDDSFVVESELLNGFVPAEYEVLIELYDAYSNQLVAALDGNQDADLYLLSLESKEYEETQVVVVTEHGGSLSLWSLLLLPLLIIRRYINP